MDWLIILGHCDGGSQMCADHLPLCFSPLSLCLCIHVGRMKDKHLRQILSAMYGWCEDVSDWTIIQCCYTRVITRATNGCSAIGWPFLYTTVWKAREQPSTCYAIISAPVYIRVTFKDDPSFWWYKHWQAQEFLDRSNHTRTFFMEIGVACVHQYSDCCTSSHLALSTTHAQDGTIWMMATLKGKQLDTSVIDTQYFALKMIFQYDIHRGLQWMDR